MHMTGLGFRTRTIAAGLARRWVTGNRSVLQETRQSHLRKPRTKAKTPRKVKTIRAARGRARQLARATSAQQDDIIVYNNDFRNYSSQ